LKLSFVSYHVKKILFDHLIVFVYFKMDIISIICILYASVLLPFICELIGIMCNLKYPKMDASNDTEIVKQSMSTFIAVLVGMILASISSGYLVILMVLNVPSVVIMLTFLVIFTILALALWARVSKTADDSFNKIQV
ncbi:MAG: hypothetical protein K5666_01150, partial [Bacilli bacterium]|nr:hypothetical protein [Bacilli bacterium]